MSSTKQTIKQSETIRKHKEFLFPAVAAYYQEPVALVKGEQGSHRARFLHAIESRLCGLHRTQTRRIL